MKPSSWLHIGRLGVIFFVLFFIQKIHSEVLNPPYFNIAENRHVVASSTCGEDVPEPELFCKLVGSNWHSLSDQSSVIEGQACDYCDPRDESKSHNATFATDGTEHWWQSPPLSRGFEYANVNLTIDLGQEFHVAYVFIKMGNSPRPGIWVLERSRDFGKTYSPWQYFAESQADCIENFGPLSIQQISRDDSVICETKFSNIIPLEGGEMPVQLLNNRPSSVHFSNSSILQEWLTATNIRIRLIRPRTTLGRLGQQLDPTVTRRFFYSIKDINIGGRCVCNGHAAACDQFSINDPNKLGCVCEHNTWGAQCEKCKDKYNQYEWSRATPDKPFVCEVCNCNGHSEKCHYDPEVAAKNLSLNAQGVYKGGGVCDDCQHNTIGINCHKCKPGYFRRENTPLDSIEVCEPCNCNSKFFTGSCLEGTGKCECKVNYQAPDCNSCSYGYYDYPECKECDCYRNGTLGDYCERSAGQCYCKPNFGGKNCKECADNFFGFPNCTDCGCNPKNSIEEKCNSTTGQCTCKMNFGGRTCDECNVGYFDYPNCQSCQCDRNGSTDEICNREDGKCICKEGYSGEKCDRCSDGYYGFPNCVECKCNKDGSKNQICDKDGKCKCNFNFSGVKCSECVTGYYDFPKCVPCSCKAIGSRGTYCDLDGSCVCKPQFQGKKCDQCKEGYYNYPQCEECNCNPAGLVAEFGGCDKMQSGKLCECKSRVKGRICNQCKDLYWNLQAANPNGCEECFCNKNGTISRIGLCDSQSGKCQCKVNVEGRTCDVCKKGTFALQSANIFGCQDCNCDVGGAINSDCDKVTGRCRCKARIRGRSCSETNEASYYPTLYQFLYEAEDWYNPSGYRARFEYNDEIFPNYSWRGYAIFDESQKQILTNISINKFSIYRVIINYVNLNKEPVNGELKFSSSEYTIGDEQQLSIVFEPTSTPRKLLVTSKLIAGRTLTLEQGPWKVSLAVDKEKFYVDYIVLLPQPYYEQSLYDKDKRHCIFNQSESETCHRHRYPDYSDESIHMNAIEAFRVDPFDNSEVKPEAIEDAEYSQKLRAEKGFVALNIKNGNNLIWDLKNGENRTYYVLLNYHTPSNQDSVVPLGIKIFTDKETIEHYNLLSSCPYLLTCRQILTNEKGQMIKILVQNGQQNRISLKLEDSTQNVNIQSITLVPVKSKWSFDYVKPQFVCIQKDGKCVSFNFPLVPNSIKLEAEADNPDRQLEEPPYMESPIVETDENKNFSSVFLVKMDSNKGIALMGGVKEAGQYAIVLHYYQPKTPSYEIEGYIQNGKDHYSGVALIQHCPSVSGCRVLLKQLETNSTYFRIQDDFTLTLKSPLSNDLSLDYVLVIPGNSFNPTILEHPNTDLQKNLIKECSPNNYYLNTTEVSDKCKRSIFSITVGFNGAALPCLCNIDGSYDHKCESFGGQCKCKPNVIGRECSMCKTGYYGFPNCQKCNCPDTAICHRKTGDCICPKGVTGQKCDKCLPFTFAFHKINGCEDCSCNPQGVALLPNSQERNLNCDLITGECNCKQNVIGRTCNECAHGFSGFPNCQLCSCDIRGATKEICDKKTSKCFCKKNVVGSSCDRCQSDSYNLDENNPNGCTKCFCFGQTDRCRKGSNMVWIQTLSSNRDWEMFNVTVKETLIDLKALKKNEDYNLEYVSNKYLISLSIIPEQGQTQEQSFDSAVYISFPKEFVGNRIKSYGGSLRYKLSNKVNSAEPSKTVTSPDLILIGQNLTVVYKSSKLVENEELYFDIKIHESDFRLLNGHSVSREDFMLLLVRLKAILLRVKFFDPVMEIELKDIQMDEAVNLSIPDAPQALSVEQCICPRGYKGTSCEQCAQGYYRTQEGFHLGQCVPCNCNGHSKECDPVTGKCFKCQFNTEGEHCERCVEGYHGDATKGTSQDCMICACPLPNSSNNFATSCDVAKTGNVLKCNCKAGYNGTRCDVCAAGHFGRPFNLGQTCETCDCNDNIDRNDHEACDNLTGQCLKCLNNSTGKNCEKCAQWFYGDSINAKNCTNCDCNKCGSEFCDHQTGECTCKANVIGKTCSKCSPGHYGFDGCSGCKACNCQEGSKGNECNDNGQCECRPGVDGKQCEKCAIGYWGYSKYGCQYCKCNDLFSEHAQCDQLTGQCQCLPGVVGEKCEKCPDRWILIPGQRCQECGNCVHVLLNETDDLEKMIRPITDEINNTSSSVYANRKFENVKKNFKIADENVKKVFENSSERMDLLDRFKRSHSNISDLTEKISKIDLKYNQLRKNLVELGNKSVSLKDKSHSLDAIVQKGKHFTSIIIEDIKALEASYANMQNKDDAPNLQESDSILKELKNNTYLDGTQSNLTEVMNLFNQTFENSKNFNQPSLDLKKQIGTTKESLKKYHDLIKELNEEATSARTSAVNAEKLFRNNLRNRTTETVTLLNSDNQKASMIVNEAKALTMNSTILLNELPLMSLEIDQQKNKLNETMIKLQKHMNNLSVELHETIKAVNSSKEHSKRIISNVKRYSETFNLTKKFASDSVKAASSYDEMIKNVQDSETNWEYISKKLDAPEMLEKISDKQLDEDLILTNKTVNKIIDEVEKFNKTHFEQNNNVNDLIEKYENANQTFQDIEEKLKNTNAVTGSATFNIKAFEMLVGNSNKTQKNVMKFEENIEELKKQILGTSGYKELLDNCRSANDSINRVLKDSNKVFPKSWLIEKNENIRKKRSILDAKISDLRKRIELAKHQANNVMVGMKFAQDSYVELNKPTNLKPTSNYNNISMRFNTNRANNLLFFIGNGEMDFQKTMQQDSGLSIQKRDLLAKTKKTDYIALEIRDKRITLLWNLGDEKGNLLQDTEDVINNVWHTVNIERLGKIMIMTISGMSENRAAFQRKSTGRTVGKHSMLDLDESKSGIFVGGIIENFNVGLAPLKNRNFEGEISNLMFDNEPYGLWNLKNKNNIQGADVEELISDSNMRFNGNSYLILNKTEDISFEEETYLNLNFKTYAKNGLLLLICDPVVKTYLAIEMQQGKIVLRYDLGSGPTSIETDKTYNDDKWHNIRVNRQYKEAKLSMDNDENDFETESPGRSYQLSTDNKIYIGGFPGEHMFHDIIKDGFDGCLKDVQLGNVVYNLNKNIGSFAVTQGCMNFIRTASFNQNDGYVEMSFPELSEDISNLQASYRFQTLNKGLMFYLTNDDATEFVAIYLSDGNLFLSSNNAEINSTSSLYFNDDKWHYVTMTRNLNSIRLDIDDMPNNFERPLGYKSSKFPKYTKLFVGGLNNQFKKNFQKEDMKIDFQGCIGDITLNENHMNFAESKENYNVQLNKCDFPMASNTDWKTILEPPNEKKAKTEIDKKFLAPIGNCVLPPIPKEEETDIANAKAIRFGKSLVSRFEFTLPVNVTKSFEPQSEFEFSFKTEKAQGVLFYVVSDNYIDFISLFFANGNLTFAFDCGSGRAVVAMNGKNYNDNQWHHVVFSRKGKSGQLKIDNDILTLESSGGATSMNVLSPIYLGGVSSSLAKNQSVKNHFRPEDYAHQMPIEIESFSGCIRDFKIQKIDYPFSSGKPFDVQPCSNNVELGTFFHYSGGYLQLKEQFKVQTKFIMEVDIKPRNPDGIIAAVFGNRDYLALYIQNGHIVFAVDNGQGEIIVKKEAELCDGNWHRIKVMKIKNWINLQVDDETVSQEGETGTSSTDTNTNIYIGSIPPLLKETKRGKLRGMITDYLGCLRVRKINDETPIVDIIDGQVTLNYCPIN